MRRSRAAAAVALTLCVTPATSCGTAPPPTPQQEAADFLSGVADCITERRAELVSGVTAAEPGDPEWFDLGDSCQEARIGLSLEAASAVGGVEGTIQRTVLAAGIQAAVNAETGVHTEAESAAMFFDEAAEAFSRAAGAMRSEAATVPTDIGAAP